MTVLNRRPLQPLASLLVLLAAMGCADEARELELRQEPPGQETSVKEHIAFTSQALPQGFQGPDSIADLLDVIPTDAYVWQGFAPSNPYPIQGDCDFERSREQPTENVEALPMTIEGVVTLHPRFFVKQSICGSDERFYGSFFIQDHSGGIMVLRDSRLAEFSYGDVVRLKVTGASKFFDTLSVLTFKDLEIVSAQKQPIAFQAVDRNFAPSDQGKVARVRGVITSEATNNNFNEMVVQSLTDPEVEWLVSLDREIGQRRPNLPPGTKVQMTGPVANSFGLRILVASFGQIERIDD